jgi:hypothetical protein
VGSRCQPKKKEREGGAPAWAENGDWAKLLLLRWAVGAGLRLLGHQAEGEEKGRGKRASGPKAVVGEFLFFFCFFIPRPFSHHFKTFRIIWIFDKATYLNKINAQA